MIYSADFEFAPVGGLMKNLRKVLLLGSGALKIGEAGEFDYSGSQAIKALKEEGLEVVVVNPNIATVQTDKGFSDRVYFLPVTPRFVEKIIAKERPDGLLAGFGGQTALNCAVELHRSGILRKYRLRVLGTPIETVEITEDRDLFEKRLKSIGVNTARGKVATSKEEAHEIAGQIGFPVMVRAGFALGGKGSGRVRSGEELASLLEEVFSHAGHVIVEPYLGGWKEVEYEVVRDSHDNCITVCNMENFDPMGIHTGESIVIAPSQTLSNYDYHKLREISINVVRELGVVGECNIQFALGNDEFDYAVIEVNARLSRSSALASKATGYPLAYVAAKLALGKSLLELRNSITGVTSACFEPALDYCVVKVPKWDLAKFVRVSKRITSEMKSVGEVMGIGRTFQEALQKALRMTSETAVGLETTRKFDDLEKELAEPTDKRIYAVGTALRKGMSVERICKLTGITRWFVHRIASIVDCERELKSSRLSRELLLRAKKLGFCDSHIAGLTGTAERQVRTKRKRMKILPVVKQIDTLAAEYPARTNYLYFTYHGSEHDIQFPHRTDRRKALVVGSGPYKIGSSVEFDWCCVNCVKTLRSLGYKTIMANCNPETVSTDYDECDALYFDELSFERIMDIAELEKPLGVVVSMGGQIPNNLAVPLDRAGVKILGTPADSIDNAEDRNRFSSLLDKLGATQPAWSAFTSNEEARRFAEEIGYPVLVRPSYVLSGAAMKVAYGEEELDQYLHAAGEVSKKHAVVITRFIPNAKEIEFDGVAQDGKIKLYAISEHIENAGIHSGDATMVLPAQRIYLETQRKIKRITQEVAQRLRITGPFNMQFIATDNEISIIELNLRASRSFPYCSKVYDRNFIELATRAIVGMDVDRTTKIDLDYVAVKVPQFSFSRLKQAEPALGVEMSSTGEVACFGQRISEAYLKAMYAVGYREEPRNFLIEISAEKDRFKFMKPLARMLALGCSVHAFDELYYFYKYHKLDVTKVERHRALDVLREGRIDMVFYILRDYSMAEMERGYTLRRAAIDLSIPLIINLQNAVLFANAISSRKFEDLEILAWDEYL
jgi:carbamoyl-phosphate synthase large subunit